MAHHIQWKVKKGCLCKLGEKKERKYFWRMESRQGMAFLACYNLKKGCKVARAEIVQVEACLSKKRKVESKGKAKAKTKALIYKVLNTFAVEVLREILQKLKELRVEV